MRSLEKIVLIGVVFSGSSLSVFAQQTANVTITGTVVPAACDITLNAGGVVDYGTIGADTLSATAVNQLGSQILGGDVNCSSATTIALQTVDNNSGTAVPANTPVIESLFLTDDILASTDADSFYGLGNTSGGEPIGNWVLTLVGGSDSGTSLDTIRSTDAGASWTAAGSVAHVGDGDFLSFADTGTTTPRAVTAMSITWFVSTAIQSTADLNSGSDNVDLNGSATISIVYL